MDQQRHDNSTFPLNGLEEYINGVVFDKDTQKFIEDEKANHRIFTRA